MADDEFIIPYTAPVMRDAILSVERWSRKIHSQQRLDVLDNLPVHERLSHLMRDVNRALSAPDEEKEFAFGRRANELLRNVSVKSQIASFLAVEGQIERLASILTSQGELDKTLSDPVFLRTLSANELIVLQKSNHTQTLEILEMLEKKKFDGLSQVINSLTEKADDDLKSGFEELGKLKLGSKEKVSQLLTKLLSVAASKATVVESVVKTLTE
jgi:hypothetical protein